MARFDELKQRAKETAEVLADVSVELYKAAEEKAKITAKKAKLTAEISSEKTSLKKLYLGIGANYYGLHKDAPEEALAQACMEVTAAIERIELKKAELDSLRNKSKCDCETEPSAEPECCCEECEASAEADESDVEQTDEE